MNASCAACPMPETPDYFGRISRIDRMGQWVQLEHNGTEVFLPRPLQVKDGKVGERVRIRSRPNNEFPWIGFAIGRIG